MPTLTGTMCNCTKGFTGENCKSEIDECNSSPCKYGNYCKYSCYYTQCMSYQFGNKNTTLDNIRITNMTQNSRSSTTMILNHCLYYKNTSKFHILTILWLMHLINVRPFTATPIIFKVPSKPLLFQKESHVHKDRLNIGPPARELKIYLSVSHYLF